MFRIIALTLALTPFIHGCSGEAYSADASRPADKQTAMASGYDGFSPYVDAAGNISRPRDFRENWVHLGSWFVNNDDQASGPGVHDVYSNPDAVEEFKRTGRWPDGAVIVKTVAGIESERLTTGNANWAGDVGVWFVMVRDNENRFPDNKAWGENWGWALFTADDPDKNQTKNWKGEGFNNCFGCHAPAQNTEWVYIDGYPTIRDSARYARLNTDRPQYAGESGTSMHGSSMQMQ